MTATEGTIGRMRPDEVQAAAALAAGLPFFQSYGMDAAAFDARLQAGLADERSHILAAREADRLIGLAWFVARAGFDRAGYLRLLAVEAAAHGQGVGRALVAALEAEHLQAGGIFVLVTEDNRPARAFYERLGYVLAGSLPGFVLADRTECVYFKQPEAH